MGRLTSEERQTWDACELEGHEEEEGYMKRTNWGEDLRRAFLPSLLLYGRKGQSEGTEYGRDKNQQRNEAIKGSEEQWCTEILEAWEDGEDGDFEIPSTQSDGTPVSLH